MVRICLANGDGVGINQLKQPSILTFRVIKNVRRAKIAMRFVFLMVLAVLEILLPPRPMMGFSRSRLCFMAREDGISRFQGLGIRAGHIEATEYWKAAGR